MFEPLLTENFFRKRLAVLTTFSPLWIPRCPLLITSNFPYVAADLLASPQIVYIVCHTFYVPSRTREGPFEVSKPLNISLVKVCLSSSTAGMNGLQNLPRPSRFTPTRRRRLSLRLWSTPLLYLPLFRPP